MQATTFFMILPAALLTFSNAWAETEKSGQSLHEQHCVACHDRLTNGNPEQLYTRPNRRVTSPGGLAKQVRRCEQNLGLRLFDEDLDAITKYLDSNFYHFSR